MSSNRQTGIRSDTYDNLILDAGAIFTNFTSPASPGTLLGATRGGASFKRVPKYKELPYEGQVGQVVGQKHLIGAEVTLEVSIIAFDLANLKLSIPNSKTSVPLAGYQEITEDVWDAEAVHSLTNIAIMAQVSGRANPMVILLDNPIAERDLGFNFKDKSETVSKWIFSAFYDEAVGFANAPWRIWWPD